MGHGGIAGVVGMDVIAAVLATRDSRRNAGIGDCGGEIDDAIESATGLDPTVDGLTFGLSSFGPYGSARYLPGDR